MKNLSAAKQSIRLASCSSNLHCERAWGLHVFAKAFRITYASYSQRGYIAPNSSGLWMTRHHLLPTTRVFVARNGHGLGTLTLATDGPLGLPMETLFRQEINLRRKLHGPIAEATCLSFDKPGSAQGIELLNRLMGTLAQSAQLSGITQIVIAVHPRHANYYTRMAGFSLIGQQKPYPAMRGHLAVPLAIHLPSLNRNCPQAYRKYFGMSFPGAVLKDQPTSKATIKQLVKVWERLQSETLATPLETRKATKTTRLAA